MEECVGCKEKQTSYQVVKFKNGEEHIRESCSVCGKHFKFVSKVGIDLTKLPSGKTTREKRKDAGLFTGCFVCGGQSRIDGFCKKHRGTAVGMALRSHCKRRGVSIWKLTKEELAPFQQPGFEKREHEKTTVIRKRIERQTTIKPGVIVRGRWETEELDRRWERFK